MRVLISEDDNCVMLRGREVALPLLLRLRDGLPRAKNGRDVQKSACRNKFNEVNAFKQVKQREFNKAIAVKRREFNKATAVEKLQR